MADARKMCTCADTKCPNHPMNHDEGCARCIQKNLALYEIPSCFFHLLNEDGEAHGYSFEEFARLVQEKGRRE